MERKQLFLIVTSAASLAVLTACASIPAAEGDTTTRDSGNTSQQSDIRLLPALGPALPDYAATGDFSADMAGWLNTVRKTMGLSELVLHEDMQQPAQDHANYQVMNQTNGHYETPGKPGFTGDNPSRRIKTRYSTTFAGEVNVYHTGYGSVNQTGGIGAIQTLIDAPFHRVVILSDFGVMGVGYNTDYTSAAAIAHTGFNVDFADNAGKLPSNYLVAYPYTGQIGVPVSWYAKEAPNPFRNTPRYIGKMVGYPITIQGGPLDRLIISSFLIQRDGLNVPCNQIDSTNKWLGKYLYGAAMCIPYKPYLSNKVYTATVTGTKNDRPFTVSWSWTTADSTMSVATEGTIADKNTDDTDSAKSAKAAEAMKIAPVVAPAGDSKNLEIVRKITESEAAKETKTSENPSDATSAANIQDSEVIRKPDSSSNPQSGNAAENSEAITNSMDSHSQEMGSNSNVISDGEKF